MDVSSKITRRFSRALVRVFELSSLVLLLGFLVERLGTMRFEDLPTLGAAVLAVSVALTSVLYNRARAYPAGAVQRRTLLTAELFFRATVLISIGISAAAIIFTFLHQFGFATPAGRRLENLAPVLLAMLPAFPIVLGVGFILRGLSILLPSLFVRLRARDLAKRSS